MSFSYTVYEVQGWWGRDKNKCKRIPFMAAEWNTFKLDTRRFCQKRNAKAGCSWVCDSSLEATWISMQRKTTVQLGTVLYRSGYNRLKRLYPSSFLSATSPGLWTERENPQTWHYPVHNASQTTVYHQYLTPVVGVYMSIYTVHAFVYYYTVLNKHRSELTHKFPHFREYALLCEMKSLCL